MPWWAKFYRPGSSKEEGDLYQRIWGISAFPSLAIYWVLVNVFSGVPTRTIAALAAAAIAIPSGLMISRRICRAVWPDLVMAADANAAKRLRQISE